MTLTMDRESIVSASQVVKNFAAIRQEAKNGKNMIVFKNNKPDLAILDIDNYEKLLKMAEQWEDLEIKQIVTERYNSDDGTRYDTDEIIKMRQMILESRHNELTHQA